jgi:hypothetical protein
MHSKYWTPGTPAAAIDTFRKVYRSLFLKGGKCHSEMDGPTCQLGRVEATHFLASTPEERLTHLQPPISYQEEQVWANSACVPPIHGGTTKRSEAASRR